MRAVSQTDDDSIFYLGVGLRFVLFTTLLSVSTQSSVLGAVITSLANCIKLISNDIDKISTIRTRSLLKKIPKCPVTDVQ